MRSRMRMLTATLSTFVVAVGTAVALGVAASPAQAQTCNGYVALTFDDGPKSGTTTSLLNALTSNGLRATMFNVGREVASNPALARAQVSAGMWVANHSQTHTDLTKLSTSQIAQEISSAQQAIQQATGVTPTLFRPPYGATNATVKSVAAQQGLTEILWSVDSQDWRSETTTAQIVQNVRGVQNGGVVLLHDLYQSTINAIPQIAADLRSRGLCSGMISPSTGRAVAPDGSGNGGGTADMLRSNSAGKCIDVPGFNSANGTKVQLYTCNDGTNQQFASTTAQELRVLGKCLEAPSGSNGAQIQINACSNTGAQKWTFGSDGTIRSVGYANMCLDVYSSSNGAPVQLYSCWGGDNQKWTRV